MLKLARERLQTDCQVEPTRCLRKKIPSRLTRNGYARLRACGTMPARGLTTAKQQPSSIADVDRAPFQEEGRLPLPPHPSLSTPIGKVTALCSICSICALEAWCSTFEDKLLHLKSPCEVRASVPARTLSAVADASQYARTKHSPKEMLAIPVRSTRSTNDEHLKVLNQATHAGDLQSLSSSLSLSLSLVAGQASALCKLRVTLFKRLCWLSLARIPKPPGRATHGHATL